MCQSFRVPVSKLLNSREHLECPPVSRVSRELSTVSSLASCFSVTPDHDSKEYSKLFIRILSLKSRPASSRLQPMSTSPRIPIIVDIFPHPFFRLSSIVSLFPPEVDTKFPRYFVDSQVVMGSSCTFSCGQGTVHFLPTCTTTDFSNDNLSRCVSINQTLSIWL